MALSPAAPRTDFVYPTSYRLSFAKFPELSFYCQSVDLPEMRTDPSTLAVPQAELKIPGTKIDFGSLTAYIIADADLQNYEELYYWMTGLAFPQDTAQFEQFITDQKNRWFSRSITNLTSSQGQLDLLDANNQVSRSFRLTDCFPSSIGKLSLDSKIGPELPPLTFPVELTYQYFILLPKTKV